MQQYLYKYKSGDLRDFISLKNDKLWVLNYERQNDPCDLMIRVNKETVLASGYSEETIHASLLPFLKALYRASSIISFGKKPDNRVLWVTYADGYRGFAIKYESQAVEEVLKGILNQNEALGEVKYGEASTDVTCYFLSFLQQKSFALSGPIPNLFGKSKSWEQEGEIRYSLGGAFYQDEFDCEKGTEIGPLKASAVYVGFRSELKEDIKQLCLRKGIPCFECSPDFFGDPENDVIRQLN
jgi:hypothetical protein